MTGFFVDTSDPDAWNKALDGLPHSYWHTWHMAAAIEAGTGERVRLFSFEDARGLRAACVFAERSWNGETDIYTPAGFTGFVGDADRAELHATWFEVARSEGYVSGYFALHPVIAGPVEANLPTTNELFVIDLRQGPEALLKHAHHSVRRAVREAAADGSTLETGRDALFGFLLQNYDTFMRDHGAHPRAIWSPATLLALAHDPRLVILGARDEEGVCAAHCYGWTPSGAEWLVNVSVRHGRRDSVRILWSAICLLHGQGTPWLHLGGGISAGDALAQFKQEKFRPHGFPLRRAGEVYRPETFEALCRQAGIGSADSNGFFPPYLRVLPQAE